MSITKYLAVGIFITCVNAINAQSTSTSDVEQITKTLTNYIEGSTNGQPDRLRKAFHEDLRYEGRSAYR